MSRYDRERYGPKACTKCGVEKPIEEFGRLRRTPDGRKAYCRACVRVLSREYAARNAEKLRQQARERYTTEVALARNKKWRAANPEKRSAHDIVARAIAAGKLIRPDRCESCAALCQPHAHHDDYARPLDVRWLCPRCHRAVHTYAEEQAA